MADMPKAGDGRKRRGEESRRKIVEAMIEVSRSGVTTPSAALIARKAGVGVRTVFRHFEEMDTLYSEMAERIGARVLPVVMAPYKAVAWRERLDELFGRRFHVYEEILPLKVAGDLHRFRSRFLMREYERFLKIERETLYEILPAKIRKNRTVAEALVMVASFQMWRQLRQDQGLTAQEAQDTIRLTASLLAG